MKLRVRYEDQYQELTLDTETAEQLWVSLGLTEEDCTAEEKEQLMQEKFEVIFNRPDYNNWHKHWRHHGNTKSQKYEDDGTGDDEDKGATWCEPLFDEVMDSRIFCKEETERDERASYEAICQWVRNVLAKKPKWAEAFIAVRLDMVSVNDYAASIGVSAASVVSKWLSRADKKLRENYPDRQI